MDQVFCYPKVNLRINPLIQLENKMDFWQNPYLLNGSVERYEKSFISCLISQSANAAREMEKKTNLRKKKRIFSCPGMLAPDI